VIVPIFKVLLSGRNAVGRSRCEPGPVSGTLGVAQP
jgi:hypothetical protein